MDYVEIPKTPIQKNKFICLAADVVYVDGVQFLVTTSRNINFTAVKHTPLQTTSQFTQSLMHISHLYTQAGFVISTILMDGQFEPLKNHLFNVVVNTTSKSGNVERCSRVIKEHARVITAGLPYRHLPKPILIELIKIVVLWLNAFPTKNVVYSSMLPREIVTRQSLDYSKHCKAEFGSYCEVYDNPVLSNTLTPRTQPTVCLRPTGNLQGMYKFFSLQTGKMRKRRQFKVLPMPDSMISTINNWGSSDKHGHLVFANRQGIPFTWNRSTPTNAPIRNP
ncbi:hypothetical protein ACHAXS_000855 [Conticribra weissflogii]